MLKLLLLLHGKHMMAVTFPKGVYCNRIMEMV